MPFLQRVKKRSREGDPMGVRRVLHVLDTAEPAGSAIFKIVEAVATGVDPSKYTIEVCFLHAGDLDKRLNDRGVRSTCVHWNGNLGDPAGMARYAALLRSSEFSIIHQHTGGRLLTSMGRYLTTARLVRSFHARASEKTGLISFHNKRPNSDATIANSRTIAEFSGDPRAVVIYPGIDPRGFSTTRITHPEVVIGTACRLELIKGLSYLFQAMAQLTPNYPGLRLEIAGEGSLRPRLIKKSQELGIQNVVSFLGWQQDLSTTMSNWDIFVLPSLDEGFGFAALEAMAAGLPVVATAVGGLPELIVDGQTGRLVPAADPPSLAAGLKGLIDNPRQREAMGSAGRQRAQADFSLSQMVERIVDVYDSLPEFNSV